MADRAADQEFVVHLYAPVDGPLAVRAHGYLRAVWAGCRDGLGMTEPIAGAAFPADLPADLTAAGDGRDEALAGQENRGADFQAVFRRHGRILNLSVACGSTQGGPGTVGLRQLWTGSAAPPGWIEFDRWWDELAAGDSGALLGQVRLYLGTLPELTELDGDALLTDLPGPSLWYHGLSLEHGLAIGELGPPDPARQDRRLVVLSVTGGDGRLSAWTWSDGTAALPPLAHYLLHQATLDYQRRVWADGRAAAEAQTRLDRCVTELYRGLATPEGAAGVEPRLTDLTRQSVDVATLLTRLRRLRQSTHVARAAAIDALGRGPGPSGAGVFGDDEHAAGALVAQLDDAVIELEISWQAAQQAAELARSHWPGRGAPAANPPVMPMSDVDEPAPPAGPSRPDPVPARIGIRLGFSVDVVAYSRRVDSAKVAAQQRVAGIVGNALRDIGLDLTDTDRQGTGDGINVFLPERTEVPRAFCQLLRAMTDWLAHDNHQHVDRLRLRLAFAVGPIGVAALGWSGNTIIEAGRLVDSQPVRDAIADNPEADLAVLVSDTLWSFARSHDHPALDPRRFRRVTVVVKDGELAAWLWTPADSSS